MPIMTREALEQRVAEALENRERELPNWKDYSPTLKGLIIKGVAKPLKVRCSQQAFDTTIQEFIVTWQKGFK